MTGWKITKWLEFIAYLRKKVQKYNSIIYLPAHLIVALVLHPVIYWQSNKLQ